MVFTEDVNEDVLCVEEYVMQVLSGVQQQGQVWRRDRGWDALSCSSRRVRALRSACHQQAFKSFSDLT